jgi:hypothetical protein
LHASHFSDQSWLAASPPQFPDAHQNWLIASRFASRLTGIKENTKFQTKPDGDGDGEQAPGGLKRLVAETKDAHGVKQVYVWHAMAGYWGGVTPTAGTAMERYEPALAYPVQSPGVTGNQPDIVMDSLSVLGLGLVHPRRVRDFYGELHAYLASCGVDGVKVDVQNIIETLGAGHGGRVAITRAYHRALEASVARSFPDNGCISCMCHNSDMLYSARQTAVVRASDDFYPRDPASHTVHVASVAYNTVFLGEFMQPDWDMFHVSRHSCRLRCVPCFFSFHRCVEASIDRYMSSPELASGGGVPRRGEGHRWLPDIRQRQAGEPQLRAAQEARAPRRLRATRAASRPAHTRLPLLRPGARRREVTSGQTLPSIKKLIPKDSSIDLGRRRRR